MALSSDLVLLDSRHQAAARCRVCAKEIAAGEGITAQLADRTFRFKCPDCYARFEADPQHYLAGHDAGCCSVEEPESPMSEWRCD